MIEIPHRRLGMATALIGLAAFTSQALAQTAAAPAAPPAPAPPVHHYHSRGGHASDDALTAQLNRQELIRVSSDQVMTETMTNETLYNYGHQVAPSGINMNPPPDSM